MMKYAPGKTKNRSEGKSSAVAQGVKKLQAATSATKTSERRLRNKLQWNAIGKGGQASRRIYPRSARAV
jgi:hypothetical protein